MTYNTNIVTFIKRWRSLCLEWQASLLEDPSFPSVADLHGHVDQTVLAQARFLRCPSPGRHHCRPIWHCLHVKQHDLAGVADLVMW